MSLTIESSVQIVNQLSVSIEVGLAVIDKQVPVEQLTVAPSTATVEYYPSSGYYFDKVTANAVTNEIDSNIQPLNIREGVTILGVEGNLLPDKPDQSKMVSATYEEQIITADTGYELASVTVEALPSTVVDTADGTITPSVVANGYIGYSQGNEIVGTASIAEDTCCGEFEARYCFFNKYGRYQIVSKQANILGTFEKPTTAGDIAEVVGYCPALTFQGWNFDDSELTNVTGDLDIGAIYIPADGKTHIYIDIENNTILDYTFNLTVLNIGTGTFYFDFGDGTTAYSASTNGLQTIAHSYLAKGSYHITTWLEGADSNGEIILGNNTSDTTKSFLGNWDNNLFNNTVKRIYLGTDTQNLYNVSIPRLRACEIISLHNNIYIASILFYSSLRYLITPKSIISGSVNIQEGNIILLSAPSNSVSTFSLTNSVYDKVISSTTGTIDMFGGSTAKYEKYTKSINLIGATSVNLRECITPKTISLPTALTTLSVINKAQHLYAIKVVVMRATTPPTLSGNLGYYCKIYVPQASLSAYQVATNWSTYASQMVGY